MDTSIPLPPLADDGEAEIVASLQVTGLTAYRPVSTDGSKVLASVADWRYSAGTDTVSVSSVTGDAFARHTILADGTHTWGPGNAAADVTLVREGTRTISWRFGTGTFPTWRFYGSYTSAVNYNRLTLQYDANGYEFVTESTGVAADFFITANTAVSLEAGGHTVSVTSGGWHPGSDNTTDLGVAGTNRWRTIHARDVVFSQVASGGRISMTNISPASPAGEYLWKMTPDAAVAPGNKNFNLIACTFGNGFGARNNVHLKFGYNINKNSTGAEDTTDPSTCLGFEAYYRPDAGNILTEGYFQIWPIGGGAEYTRPFMYNFRHSDNRLTTYLGADELQYLRGSNGALLLRYISANYALEFFDSSVLGRLVVDAGGGQVRVNANGSFAAALTRNFHSEGTTPGCSMYDTGGGADGHLWDFYSNGGVFVWRAVNDGATVANNVFSVARSGVALTSITFGATLLAGADNTYDLGASGATRPRSIYVGTHVQIEGNSSGASLRVPNGTAMRTGSSGTSYFLDLGDVSFRDGDGSSSGADVTIYGQLSLMGDAILVRDAANVVAQKNGTTAQTFRVYGTTTGPKYLSLAHDGTDATISTPSGAGNIFMVPTGGTVVQIHCGASSSHLYVHNTYTSPSNREVGLVSWISNEFIFGTSTLGGGPARGIRINTENAAPIRFSTTATGRWEMSSSGHFLGFTDNAYDIGASGATRPRSIYFGTQAIGPVGSATSPSYSFTGQTATEGMYTRGGGTVTFTVSGAASVEFQSSGSVCVTSGGGIYWNTGAIGSGLEVALLRDAANTLAQKNGTNAQEFRVYNTTTGPEYGSILWASNIFTIGTNAGRVTRLRTNGTDRWEVGATTGHLISLADATYDLGGSSNRIRDGYFSSTLRIGTTVAGAGTIRLANTGSIWARDAGNTADCQVIGLNSSNIVSISEAAGVYVAVMNHSGGRIGFFGTTPIVRPTYGAPSGGGPTRTTFDTTTVTLAQLAERVRAIIDDFRSYGLFA